MRIMYDAINALNLPVGARLYAGYVDGRWPDADAISQRFPIATVVRIATSPSTNDGVVGDGPPDNGTWPEWVAWTVRRRAAGVDPTMYTDADQWPTGIAAFKAAGVPAPHWWIARYLNSAPSLSALPAIPPGAVALQCFDFGAYDLSVVADYWPGVDPAPHPAAAAAHLEEDEMSTTSVNGRAGLSWAAGSRHVVQVTYDPAHGDPQLRAVLALTTGPFVLGLNPTKGSGILEIPTQYIAMCRGVILEEQSGGTVIFDVCAV